MTRGRRAAPPRSHGSHGGRTILVGGLALLVAGLALLASLGWQVWVRDPAAGTAQADAAAAQSARWSSAGPSPRPTDAAARPDATRSSSEPSAAPPPTRATRAPSTTPSAMLPRDLPVRTEPARTAATVAVLKVPRFGRSWQRIVRQGIDESAVLNSFSAGVGHYPATAMPGGLGNFAVAGHDTGWGDAFRRLGGLRIGDPIIVQTADGWYTYAFRNFQWVQATQVDVLAPVPTTRRAAEARLITMTTCDPPYDGKERTIAYGVLESFRPTAAGAPKGW